MARERDRLIAAVNEFADCMKQKLLKKFRGGWRGWESLFFTRPGGFCEQKMMDCIVQHLLREEPQEIDIANFLMFLWHGRQRRENTAKTKGKQCKSRRTSVT